MRLRQRVPINVWPALADLMAVLAVPSLLTAVGLYPYFARHDEAAYPQRGLLQGVSELETRRGGLEQEAALNQAMFQAIQDTQRLVDRMQQAIGLRAGPDQTFRFGEDLVFFERNSAIPVWRADAEGRLRRLCAAVSVTLSEGGPQQAWLRGRFAIVVEGHTDATKCPDAPECNWPLSAARAAVFVARMRDPVVCPGGAQWDIRPMGFADTRPLPGATDPSQHRRIAVRLVPDYERIIASANKRRGPPKRAPASKP